MGCGNSRTDLNDISQTHSKQINQREIMIGEDIDNLELENVNSEQFYLLYVQFLKIDTKFNFKIYNKGDKFIIVVRKEKESFLLQIGASELDKIRLPGLENHHSLIKMQNGVFSIQDTSKKGDIMELITRDPIQRYINSIFNDIIYTLNDNSEFENVIVILKLEFSQQDKLFKLQYRMSSDILNIQNEQDQIIQFKICEQLCLFGNEGQYVLCKQKYDYQSQPLINFSIENISLPDDPIQIYNLSMQSKNEIKFSYISAKNYQELKQQKHSKDFKLNRVVRLGIGPYLFKFSDIDFEQELITNNSQIN